MDKHLKYVIGLTLHVCNRYINSFVLGVYTRYKPFLNKDKVILKRLAKVSECYQPREFNDRFIL